MSTATGLVYCRQNAGLFESERHPLIEVSQAFTNFDFSDPDLADDEPKAAERTI